MFNLKNVRDLMQNEGLDGLSQDTRVRGGVHLSVFDNWGSYQGIWFVFPALAGEGLVIMNCSPLTSILDKKGGIYKDVRFWFDRTTGGQGQKAP